ncbi:hypothetical protein [Nostoc sp. CCY 9925]|jgi:hypothetical protein|uniref:hypothetical protein n=1 Tax=Nostoc sp. CCY 9925 TaxID=3103865 RepID=UPI0039C74288
MNNSPSDRRRSCAGIRFNTQLALQFNPLSNSHVLAVTSPTTFLKLMPIYVAPIRDFFNPQWLSPLELATGYNLVF